MITKKKVLVVEDENDIVELLTYNLEKAGYITRAVKSGEDALSAIKEFSPDIILLDLMLPGIDGLEVCRLLQSKPDTSDIPVIMVTARGGESDIIAGLELGADDYVSKPFSPKVLLARVKAVLRGRNINSSPESPILEIGDIKIHAGRREVTIDGAAINLTYTEFEILKYFASKPGWVFMRYELVNAVHGEDYAVTDRSIDVQIVNLRKKLGETGSLIETIRGVGYRLKD